MPHPDIDNRTPFGAELLLLADTEGRPLLVPLLQAVFAIGRDGELAVLDPQPAAAIGGTWWGEPGTSSVRLEPQIAPRKPGVDVVLHGHAVATQPGTTEMRVGLRLGPLQKIVHVVGDRRVLTGGRIGAPAPFERIPLRWEHAFGGWDRRDPDPSRHVGEPRNPLGRGLRDPRLPRDDTRLLPNLEDPAHPWRDDADRPPPAGFGFIGPDWHPRAAFAGTYDAAWMRSRRPLLPTDFDPRFFNAAPEGLVCATPLRGDEAVTVAGVVPEGRLDFRLPSLPAPSCELVLRGGRVAEPVLALDTVVIDGDARTVQLTWRGAQVVRSGPQDLLGMRVHVAGLGLRNPRFAA
jgi:hypothetical protein